MKTEIHECFKHKYVFIKNVIITNIRFGMLGKIVNVKYRGEYKCANCGKGRTGKSK
jgi:hypothetical protein